jgi:hypothetical protein
MSFFYQIYLTNFWVATLSFFYHAGQQPPPPPQQQLQRLTPQPLLLPLLPLQPPRQRNLHVFFPQKSI